MTGPERLLRIGSFSRQARLSPHQLRHYHEVGLLLPASVDPESGYRYYSESQMATAEAIALLRSVDMPLAEIRELLRDPGAERVQAALDRQRARLERRLEEASHQLGRLRELMKEGIRMDTRTDGDLVEVVLDAVRAHLPTGQHILMLKERDGERVLGLWVGPSEANAAALRLHAMTTARPVTHDLMAVVVRHSGAAVDRVVVTRCAEQVFYATVHLRGPGGAEEIDARPSDAINLALRTGAPILVAATVMNQAARTPDPNAPPRVPTIVAMAVEAGTDQEMGLLHLRDLPGPGDQVTVHAPTGWRVVAVEPAEGEAPPRVVVRRPNPE